LIINTLGFLVTAYDKYLAKNHKRRISEKILLTFVGIGGTIVYCDPFTKQLFQKLKIVF
jgi:uncharacterized membrane protein YsdA (DUF1294 family)